MNDASKSLLAEDPSGNSILLDGKGNISIKAPNTISLDATDINITASKNITTSAGMNISESAGANKSTSVGMMKTLSVGLNYMTNVLGQMGVFVKGNFESHTEKDKNVTAMEGLQTNSEKTIIYHAQKEIQNNSAEKTKMF